MATHQWPEKDLVIIGFIASRHGVKGQFKIILERILNQSLNSGDWLYFILEEKPIPVQIIQADTNTSNQLLLAFNHEHINAINDFTGIKIACNEGMLAPDNEEAEDLFEGYLLYDQNENLIGLVRGIEKAGEATWLLVDYENEEQMVPFHENLIIKASEEEKKLFLNIMDGLLD